MRKILFAGAVLSALLFLAGGLFQAGAAPSAGAVDMQSAAKTRLPVQTVGCKAGYDGCPPGTRRVCSAKPVKHCGCVPC